MKLKFKHQAYQTQAVNAVVDCFKGQPSTAGIRYRIDPGTVRPHELEKLLEEPGFRNQELALTDEQLLQNIQQVQRQQHLLASSSLVKTAVSPLNLDVEMETGTGKTYCYIKTILELHRRYGWGKFIVVVPSIAIREGIYQALEITADHFQESYHHKAKFFIYNSKQLHKLEGFSSDAGINVMIINVQAFNARGKDNRRIYEELDDFQSRRPIDVIQANRPILILDEPQKMEGAKTLDSLRNFQPLFVLRYSATHKTQHNQVYRLDALDAYNQKLVKKIAVRGISVRGLAGTNAYLYLEAIEISPKAPPTARMEIEQKQRSGIVRKTRKLQAGSNLYDLSGGLEQYRGLVIADINAHTNTVEFTNGQRLQAGEATGDGSEATLRQIQIREAIKAHLEKEQQLYPQGIKVLTLFFIDEVAKYRQYTHSEDGDKESGGEYAKMFETEYQQALQELEPLPSYKEYLHSIPVSRSHNGYFSVDKKGRLINSKESGRGNDRQCDDVSAYDLILKNKERLLSLEEPTRFIFSHSALREGWDNPNVFVICTLKHSDNTISRRQEVGRGLRLAVNQLGERQDEPAAVHQTNVLTVVTSESYTNFVTALQRDIRDSLAERPRTADATYFAGKQIQTAQGPLEVSKEMAAAIEFYLIQNAYVDVQRHITPKYDQQRKDEQLADLPPDFAEFGQLKDLQPAVFHLIDSVYSDAQSPQIADDRDTKANPLNDNFYKKEFRQLWDKINRKAVYSVHFDSAELIAKCVATLNQELRVAPLQYVVERGEQTNRLCYEQVLAARSFELQESATKYQTRSIRSTVKYDLLGKVAHGVGLTRKTVAAIFTALKEPVFAQFQDNPEDFMAKAIDLIQEQKASDVVESLHYDPIAEKHDTTIFTAGPQREDLRRASRCLRHHISDYLVPDSQTERRFVQELEASSEVIVYAKLPKSTRGFAIPTPVGNYSPDWAISFKEEQNIRHIYFVAETKGSMSSLELRKIEEAKITCARKFFAALNNWAGPEQGKKVKYDVVDSFKKLMEIACGGVAPGNRD